MDAISTHREGLKWAFELLEMLVADVTQGQADWIPAGIANPLGATFAHAVLECDALIHMFIGQAPLYETAWKDRTGVSEPMKDQALDWGRRLKVDLTKIKTYAKAVYAETDSILAGFSANDLGREIDLSDHGLGVRTLSWCLTALVISHLNNMIGEISVLKGLQGARGYPF
jgi:hypothetical protein